MVPLSHSLGRAPVKDGTRRTAGNIERDYRSAISETARLSADGWLELMLRMYSPRGWYATIFLRHLRKNGRKNTAAVFANVARIMGVDSFVSTSLR